MARAFYNVRGAKAEVVVDQPEGLFSVLKEVDGLAADTVAETILGVLPYKADIKNVQFIPDSALTANNSNYASITFSVRRAANSYSVREDIATLATQITGTGDWAAWTPVEEATALSNNELSVNDLITFRITKTGSGVAVPAGATVVEFAAPRHR